MGHSNDDSRWAELSQGSDCSPHGGPSGDSIVNQNHDLAGNLEGLPIAPVGLLPACKFQQFALGDSLDLFLADTAKTQYIFIHYTQTPGSNGTHCKLWLTGCAEFAYAQHIKGRLDCGSDFERYGYPATGQRENQDVVVALIVPESSSKPLTRISTVAIQAHLSSHAGVSLSPQSKAPSKLQVVDFPRCKIL
jgi:hypothetical protein